MLIRVLIPIFLVLVPTFGHCQDFEAALGDARELAQRHRYAEIIELLTPFAASEDPEIRYVASAEIGRSYFHLGRYRPAYRAFREAVLLHPERPETAIYLEAASYLIGDTNQAFTIFEELLRSGARDLYLAVTLPGSRKFLAEPAIRSLLDQFAIPLPVDVPAASVLGVELGLERDRVIEQLGAVAADPSSSTLTREAGPAVIWAFAFDDQRRLSEIVLHASYILDYTPYRIQFAGDLDRKTTPAAAIAAWGAPVATDSDNDHIVMTWKFESHHLIVEFGPPGAYRPTGLPEGAATMRIIRLRAGQPAP